MKNLGSQIYAILSLQITYHNKQIIWLYREVVFRTHLFITAASIKPLIDLKTKVTEKIVKKMKK